MFLGPEDEKEEVSDEGKILVNVKNQNRHGSEPGKIGKIEHHIIVVWVDNEAGVLARVAGLFSGRGYNIESLAVCRG